MDLIYARTACNTPKTKENNEIASLIKNGFLVKFLKWGLWRLSLRFSRWTKHVRIINPFWSANFLQLVQNIKSQWENPIESLSSDDNFQTGLQKYIISAALYDCISTAVLTWCWKQWVTGHQARGEQWCEDEGVRNINTQFSFHMLQQRLCSIKSDFNTSVTGTLSVHFHKAFTY